MITSDKAKNTKLLISFAPFSTKDQVTRFAGGGMDVVKEKMA
jgi:chemotaxis protein histidine kinase CheA